MILNSQFGSTLRKPIIKNYSQERSKTPNKKSINKLGQRQSKSVAKKDERIDNPFMTGSLMEPIKQWQEGVRYYYLGRGNNHEAVRRALSQRKNLVQSMNHEGILFKWTQSAFGFKYHKLGKQCLCFNHFEFHRQISNKQRLVWNMINFCQSNKLNAFSYIPTTFIIDLTTGQQDMALHGFLKFYNRNIPEGYTGQKVQSILLPKMKHLPYNSTQLKKKGHGNFYCKPTCPKTFFGKSNTYLWILKPTFMNRGRGVALFGNISEFQKLIWQFYQGEGLQDYEDKKGIGELYRVSEVVEVQVNNEGNSNQLRQQRVSISPQKQQELSPSPPKNQLPQNNTELSPERDRVKEEPTPEIKEEVKSDTKIEEKIESKPQSSSSLKAEPKPAEKANNLRVLSFIAQKYIECPMLINERKFDIRVWALLTHNYEIYFFKEGYLRFSSHKYSADNHKNPFIHLTNNSVQKHCTQFDEGSGNQITLSAFKDHLPSEEIYMKIQAKIREMIWLSMCSARRRININGRKECFEVFGYDFMVDESYRTWLIEVNSNPAIDECSTVLKMLIPRMLDDMFKLTLDKLYNLKQKQNREEYPVIGYEKDQNMWQLLGDFKQGINEKTMGKRLTLVHR